MNNWEEWAREVEAMLPGDGITVELTGGRRFAIDVMPEGNVVYQVDHDEKKITTITAQEFADFMRKVSRDGQIQ
jgi:hypothetical protein